MANVHLQKCRALDRAYNIQLAWKVDMFCVPQGNIEHVATMNPIDRCKFFEQVSGSDVHRKEYEELDEEVRKQREEVAFIALKQKNFDVEKKQKKEQK